MTDFITLVTRALPFALGPRLERFSERLLDLDALVGGFARELDRLCIAVRTLVEERAHPAPPTFVYVLPPDAPMMAQMARVGRSSRQQLSFTAHRPILAGTWVVVAGEATTRAVMVGNNFQTSAADFQGQVCKTTDDCLPGMLLRVELEAP